MAITVIYHAEQNNSPQSTDTEISQLIEDASFPNIEERAIAIKNARENSNLPSWPVDGRKDGCFGTWTSSDGEDRYVGEFLNNRFNGWGVYLWPNGSFHVGYWVDSGRSGFGTHYYTDGTVRECVWVPDYTDMTASCK